MSLSLQEVEHIAKLARLKLTDEQKARYREQLEAILDHVAKLQELDTQDVPPTASVAVDKCRSAWTSRARPVNKCLARKCPKTS